ncbi:MAG: hypothetical protein IPH59_13335 [bacterium]|nr:hypothetical protein [bacterium]
MRRKLFLLLIAAMTVVATTLLVSCGDTSTDGNTKSNWKINMLLARNGETGFVNVYAEIFKNDAAFISAVLKVDDLPVQSLGNGKYSANLDPDLLSDTSLISITTPLDPFQFQQMIVVPDTFTFNFEQLPSNQVFSSTNVVNVVWTASDFENVTGSYFIVTEPSSSLNSAVGSFNLISGTQGTIPRDAFRDSQGTYKTGTYNVWVVSRIEQPIASPNIPFTIPDGVFVENIDRVGVTGQIGSIYISPRKTITAVAGS